MTQRFSTVSTWKSKNKGLKFEPNKKIRDWVKKNNRKIYIYNDAKKAARGADVIFSDKVISLNDKVNKIKKIKQFAKFKIDKKLISYAKKNCIFLLQKNDFRVFFSAFYCQRWVAEPGPTPSPWSILLQKTDINVNLENIFLEIICSKNNSDTNFPFIIQGHPGEAL